ncbi:MAG: type II toxin-antitoxin system RelE/ParE family toxin [Candidatus Sericytochromatia bacterium]|nr:type II toxin-antitoxin system RelE/ParE family toxin [Candidatus Tanganyikabacteria bacterium]
MSLEIEWTKPAAQDFRRLDRPIAQRVKEAVERLAQIGHGDIKQLKGSGGERRLRVGDWRVRFERDDAAKKIRILHVLHRREAYRE